MRDSRRARGGVSLTPARASDAHPVCAGRANQARPALLAAGAQLLPRPVRRVVDAGAGLTFRLTAEVGAIRRCQPRGRVLGVIRHRRVRR